MRASQLKLYGSSVTKISYMVIDVCTKVKERALEKKLRCNGSFNLAKKLFLK